MHTKGFLSAGIIMASLRTTDSLENVPNSVAVSFLPNFKDISKKALNRGYIYFSESYIHDIKVCGESCGNVSVEAKCWRSLRKNETPHKLCTDFKNEKLVEACCSCKAG